MTDLLYGPYHPPPLRGGDRAFCQHRGREVVVTGWSEAPLPWPLGRFPGGWDSPVVDEGLARAIRTEPPQALRHWLGVSGSLVRAWRTALGAVKALRRWAPEELALLGSVPDAEVARLTGRSLNSVAIMRHNRGVPTFSGGNGRPPSDPGLPVMLDRARRLEELSRAVSEEKSRWEGEPGGRPVADALQEALADLAKASEALGRAVGEEAEVAPSEARECVEPSKLISSWG